MPPRRRRPPRPGALSDLPPHRILRTILLLQLSYYLTALILIGFSTLVLGQRFTLDLILDWRSVRGDVTVGWLVGGCWVGSSFLTYVFLSPFHFGACRYFSRREVRRLILNRVIPILLLLTKSKLVPDFALTLHFVHLLITSLYSQSIPTNLLWWLLQFGSAFLMVSLGVWAARYREMQPITFGLGTKGGAQANGNATAGRAAGGNGRTGDEHVRGGRGGRTQGGGPSYEMVPIKEEGVLGDENV